MSLLRMLPRLALLAALVLPVAARADRRDIYTLLSLEPGVAGFTDPVQGRAGSTQFQGGLGLMGYYGLTNSLHLGAAVRFASSSGMSFAPSAAALPSGPAYVGTLLANDRSLSASVLALYRFDTGYRVAPALEGEVGYTSHDFHDLAIVPQGSSYGIPLAATRQTAPFGRGSLRVEWRFADNWVFSTGAAFTRTGLPAARWQLSFPILVGLVW